MGSARVELWMESTITITIARNLPMLMILEVDAESIARILEVDAGSIMIDIIRNLSKLQKVKRTSKDVLYTH